MTIQLFNGDCLEIMDKLIADGVKVDAVITDPPYGTTACKWDNVIPFDKMWGKLKSLRKNISPIVLFGNEPFSSKLRLSNLKEFKYDWIWEKEQGANFMLCKKQPYKVHEIISIFGKTPLYLPQKTKGKPYVSGKGFSGEITNNVIKKQTANMGTRYPRSIQKFNTEKSKGSKHPTQKPLALMEYLIKTYTNQGDTVLDFCMGSGTTGVACKKLNRNFIGIELDKKYFDIAEKRINETTV